MFWYTGNFQIDDDKKELFTKQVCTVLNKGGMMDLNTTNVFEREITLLNPVRWSRDSEKIRFCYNYFDDQYLDVQDWGNAGFDMQTLQIVPPKRIGIEESNLVLQAVYMLYEVSDIDTSYGFAAENDYNDSAQKTPAVRKNVRGMNAPITNNATIIQTGFSSGIVGFSWPDVLQNAVIRCIALLFQEKHFR